MKNKNLLRSTIFLLIMAITIGSFALLTIAKNSPGNGGMSGGGMKQGNQVQEPANTPNQLQEQKKTQLMECEEECHQNCEQNCNGECTGDCDGVPLDAEQYKDMTITEIAEVWGVNDDTLLADIIENFNLSGDYDTDSTLNDLRENNLFSSSEFVDFMEETY